MRNFLLFSALLLFLYSCSFNKKEASPNIVFILADDLGWPQIGCYGSDYYKTPNIDKLAKEGVRFTNAYAACAVCSPTRASIITGKYPARLHLTDFIPGGKFKNKPLKTPDWQKYLLLEEKSIGELAKEQGYKTALFGKWHLSQEKTPPNSLPFNPDKQGFDETFVTYKPSKSLAQSWQMPENDGHNVDTITNLAVDFMERNQNDPFMLFVWHNTIHDPLIEKEETIKKYQNADTAYSTNHPVIAAMIERLDNSTGRILSKLQELKLEENTVVVFFSDNGGKQAHADQTPLRAGKGWIYEGGIREPLIIKWPERIEPDSKNENLVISNDLYTTFASIIGVENIPENDGVDLTPNLLGNGQIERDKLFWHYPHYHGGSGMVPGGAVRKGNYKLIEWYEPKLTGEKKYFELYNLSEDISEIKDISENQPEKARELLQLLEEWRNEVGAQMPLLNQKE